MLEVMVVRLQVVLLVMVMLVVLVVVVSAVGNGICSVNGGVVCDDGGNSGVLVTLGGAIGYGGGR